MRRNNLVGILVCTALVLGLLVHLAPSILPSATPVKASSKTIALTGYYPYWNSTNPPIYATQGETITMMLSSGDSAYHQFLVDFDGDSSDVTDCPSTDPCSASFHTSTIVPYTFTVSPTIQPGTYHYLCVIHYTTMVGLFIVQSPGPDYGLTSNPSSVSILQGSNANSTITVSSTNNFAGMITLSASASPSGPTTSFSTNTVMVSSGTTASSKLTISIPQSTSPGSYSITVTGTNGSAAGTHSTNISVSVGSPNFSISPNPTSLTVTQGSSGTSSITLTSMNGFAGTLTLTATVTPSGPQVSLNPSTVSLTSGGSALSTLTVSTATSGYYSTPVAQGNYAVNITVSSGSLSHSTSLSLSVGSTSSAPPSAATLPLLAIAGGVIAAIIVVTAVAFFLRRRRH